MLIIFNSSLVDPSAFSTDANYPNADPYRKLSNAAYLPKNSIQNIDLEFFLYIIKNIANNT